MPSLPIPLGSPLSGGDLPVRSIQDVLDVLPEFFAPDTPAPVRDAIALGIAFVMRRYQKRITHGAKQADILTARGIPLTQAAADLGVYRQSGEADDPLVARALQSPQIVTPTAILATVGALLAPFTPILPLYSEAFDRWYLRKIGTSASPSPRGYLYKQGTTPQSPDDATRLYPSQASWNGGVTVPQREPGAARVWQDIVGRNFLIRIPDLSSLNARCQPVYRADQPATAPRCFLLGRGVSSTNTNFMRQNATTTSVLYAQIISAVSRIVGAGVRWTLLADPTLTS